MAESQGESMTSTSTVAVAAAGWYQISFIDKHPVIINTLSVKNVLKCIQPDVKM